jgi:hypothetical protein
MLRSILGVVAGVVAGAVTIFIVEAIGHLIYPPPPGVDFNDPVVLNGLIQNMPFGAKVSVLAAWALGIFAGSAVAVFVAERRSWPAWVVAIVLFAGALSTMVVIPHPDWMAWSATVLTLASAISAAYIWARS